MLVLLGAALAAPYTSHDGCCRAPDLNADQYVTRLDVTGDADCRAACEADAECTGTTSTASIGASCTPRSSPPLVRPSGPCLLHQRRHDAKPTAAAATAPPPPSPAFARRAGRPSPRRPRPLRPRRPAPPQPRRAPAAAVQAAAPSAAGAGRRRAVGAAAAALPARRRPPAPPPSPPPSCRRRRVAPPRHWSGLAERRAPHDAVLPRLPRAAHSVHALWRGGQRDPAVARLDGAAQRLRARRLFDRALRRPATTSVSLEGFRLND